MANQQSFLPSVPFKVPVLDDQGFMHPTWLKFIYQLFNRAGGTVAPSNLELAQGTSGTSLASLQAQITALQTQSNTQLGLSVGRQL